MKRKTNVLLLLILLLGGIAKAQDTKEKTESPTFEMGTPLYEQMNVNEIEEGSPLSKEDWEMILHNFEVQKTEGESFPKMVDLYESHTKVYGEYIVEGKPVTPVFLHSINYKVTNENSEEEGSDNIDENKKLLLSGTIQRVFKSINGTHFLFSKDWWYTNTDDELLSVKMDADNGKGMQNVSLDEPIAVLWQGLPNENKEKTITLEITSTSGTTTTSFSMPPPPPCNLCETLQVPDPTPWPNPMMCVGGACVNAYTFQATIPYNGQLSFGNAYIRYSADGIFDKPFIIVEGIDFDSKDTFEDTQFGDIGWCQVMEGGNKNAINCGKEDDYVFVRKYPQMIQEMLDEGYDLVMLDFGDGADYVQRNAMLMVQLLELINQYKVGNHPNILAGTSMGGQVTRYALRYMEQYSMEHCVSVWISIDSPHQGSNVTPGLQEMFSFLSTQSLGLISTQVNAKLSKTLARPAARQFLTYQAIGPDITNAYYAEIGNMGYPQETFLNVGIANGTRNGAGQGYADGDKLLSINWSPNLCLGTDFIDLNVSATPGGNYSSIFTGKVPSSLASIAGCLSLGPVGCSICASLNVGFNTTNVGSTGRADAAPGGYRTSIHQIARDFNDIDIKTPLISFSITEYEANHAFIHTTSALDINTNNLYYNFDIDGPNALPNLGLTPFDAVYAPQNNNEQHSEATDENIDFMLRHIRDYQYDLPELLNAASPRNGVYNIVRNTYNVLHDVAINNGGKLHINGAMEERFGSAHKAYMDETSTNSTLHIYTGSNCNSDAVIDIQNNGELILGDAAVNNIGVLHVTAGSNLILRGGSQLTINDNSRLIIEEGATLTIQDINQINLVDPNSVLEVRGVLAVGANDVFEPTGNGYVVFTNPKMQLTNNGVIKFTKPSGQLGFQVSNNSMLDLRGAPVWPNTQFIVDNARVGMGANSTLNFGATEAILTDAVFYGDKNNYYNAVIVNGQAHTIKKSVFRYGDTGLMGLQTVYGNAILTMSDTQILNCNTGLHLIGAGADLSSVDINSMTEEGYLHELATQPSVLTECSVTNADRAIVYNGGANADLYLDNPFIWTNGLGIQIDGGATLSGQCGSITQSDTYGILAGLHSIIDLSDDSKMNITENGTSIGLDLAYYLNLDEGHNDFVPTVELVERVINGTMRKSIECYSSNSSLGYPIRASENHWNTQGGISTGKILRDIEDYELRDINNHKMQIDGSDPFTFVACGTQPPSGGGCSPCAVSIIKNCNNCEAIETPLYNGVSLNNAMEDAFSTMVKYNPESGNDRLAIEKFNQILTYPYSEINTNERGILDLGYEKMKEAYGNACKTGEISTNRSDHFPDYDKAVQQVLEVITMWKNDGESGTGPFNGPIAVGGPCNPIIVAERPSIDEGHVYQAIGKNKESKKAYQYLAETATEPKVVELAHYWECIATKDEMFANNAISVNEYQESVLLCRNLLVLNNQIPPIMTGEGENEEQNFVAEEVSPFPEGISNVMLAPNPTNGALNIYFELPEGITYSVEVLDALGKISSHPGSKGESSFGINSVQLDLSELSSGVYYVRIATSLNQVVEKIVVSK